MDIILARAIFYVVTLCKTRLPCHGQAIHYVFTQQFITAWIFSVIIGWNLFVYFVLEKMLSIS
jgi:hypothetical protein